MAHEGVLHAFSDAEKDIITRDVEVTTGLWSGNTGSLTTLETSATQLGKSNAAYFVDVYNVDPDLTSSAEVQFSIAYGHVSGAGSPTLAQEDTSTLATKAVYFQFKSALLDDPESSLFTFENSTTSEDIYVISIARSRFKGVVDPGNWQLTLQGSNGTFTFVDNSLETLGINSDNAGRSFSIYTGSIDSSTGTTLAGPTASNGEGYGTFYPAKGLFILNPSAIADTVGFVGRTTAGGVGALNLGEENSGSAANFFTVADALTNPLAPFTGSLVGDGGTQYEQYNWHGLYRAITKGADFQARSQEVISSEHFFIRIRNDHATTSNNPTWINEATGKPVYEEFVYNPKVFITTVGLYNRFNELVAVAKLSRPLEKSKTKEALIRVRLDF